MGRIDLAAKSAMLFAEAAVLCSPPKLPMELVTPSSSPASAAAALLTARAVSIGISMWLAYLQFEFQVYEGPFLRPSASSRAGALCCSVTRLGDTVGVAAGLSGDPQRTRLRMSLRQRLSVQSHIDKRTHPLMVSPTSASVFDNTTRSSPLARPDSGCFRQKHKPTHPLMVSPTSASVLDNTSRSSSLARLDSVDSPATKQPAVVTSARYSSGTKI